MSSQDLLFPYLLTPRNRVLLEKLRGFKVVKKFPAFYETRMFITAFTSARHLSLSWTSSIQSIIQNPTSWRSILILFPIYAWISQVVSFPQFPHQNPESASPLHHMDYMPRPSHSFLFYDQNNIGWGIQIIKLFIM